MRIYFVTTGLIACSSPAAPQKPSEPIAQHQPATPDRLPNGLPSDLDDGLEPPAPVLRLPRNFLPASYTATLAIDPARSGFDGTIAITGNVAQRSGGVRAPARGGRLRARSRAAERS